MVEVGFESLRKIQLQERNYAALVNLDEDFYTAYSDYVALQQKQLSDKFSFDSAMTFEGTRKLLSDLMRRRQQKILLKAIRDFQGGEVSSTGLAKEEKELYTSVIRLLSEYEESVNPSKSAKPAPQPPARNRVEVRILADVPEFVGVKETVGPFKPEQTALLDAEDAKLLIEQGMASAATG